MLKIHKDKIRKRLVSDYAYLFSQETVETKDLEGAINAILDDIVKRERMELSDEERKKIVSELVDDFVGFGPIEGLVKDPEVTEIMINGPKKIYAERKGKTELTGVTFDDEQQLMAFIYKILAATRRHVDESYPYTEIALKGGARVNIIIPPLAMWAASPWAWQ